MPRALLASSALVLLPAVPAGAGTLAAGSQSTALVVERVTSKSAAMKRPATLVSRTSVEFATSRSSGVFDMSDMFAAEGIPTTLAALFKGPYESVSVHSGYVSMPAFALLKGAKPWLYLDDTTGGAGTDYATDYLSPASPVGELDAYRHSGATVTAGGKASVHGISTTRYHVVFDVVRSVAAFAPAAERARAVASARKLVRLSHRATGAADLWVDPHGTTWRERSVTTQAVDDKPLRFGPVTDLAEVVRFGVPVKVELPPRSKVMTEQEFQQLGKTGGNP